MNFYGLISGIGIIALLAIQPPTKQQNQSPTQTPTVPTRTEGLRQPAGEYSLINDVEELPIDVGSLKRTKFAGDTEFVSMASRVLAMYEPKVEARTCDAMVTAAKKLLDSLPQELASKAVHKLDSKERSQWTNLPARPDAGGVRMGDMNEEQVKLTLNLLATMLSDYGYEKLRLIMLGDDELIRGRRRNGGLGTDAFAIVVFGEPDPEKLWAIQFDGHHIGLNIAVRGKQMTLGPSFIGAQPFEFKLGKHTLKPMEGERVLAFKIAQSLSDEQFRQALGLKERGQLKAGPGRDGEVPDAVGVRCKEFSDEQKSWLYALINEWVGWLPEDRAVPRMEQIKLEFDEMRFSWNGPRKTGSDVSYTVQGPSLLIEFAYQDLGGVPQQHLHTQYRNLKNEYGKKFK